ncbi:hypothetical protein SALBM217S_00097 [Streptomyces griseoloalbus]
MRTISPSAAFALPEGSLGAVASSATRDSYTSAETHAASSAGPRPSQTRSRRHSLASRSSSPYSRASRLPCSVTSSPRR